MGVSRDHRSRVGDRHRMGCFCGVYLSWIVDRAIQNHGHRVDLSIDPPCYDVDDRKMDASRGLHMNDLLDDHHDRKMDGSLDGNRDHRTNDLLVYRNLDGDHHGVLVDHHKNVTDDQNDLMKDVNHGLRRSARLDDHLMDDDHRDVLVGRHMNAKDDRNDLKLGATTDVNLYLRTNDRLDDQMTGVNLGVSLCHRMNVTDDLNDLNLDGNLDVNRGLHRNDPLVDLNLDVKTGENRGLHMSDLLGDLKTDGNHVNRNYAPRDLKMDASLDVMNHHVKLMVFPNTNCDRMSHDHLRYDRQMMRHHDTSRMDEMILDGNHSKKDDPMHLRRVNRRMMVCPKMDDRKMI